VTRRELTGGSGPIKERRAPREIRTAGISSLLKALNARAEEAGSDRGSATVWVVCLLGAVCAVFGVLLAQGEAVLARHRAAGAADLAALAAADHWTDGVEKACATAGRVTGAQGSRLVRCAIVGEVSDVTAASGAGPFTAEVRARAGPAEARGPEPPDRSPPPAPRATAP
jgi:secretion/DNA translocation related TadE-like protein